MDARFADDALASIAGSGGLGELDVATLRAGVAERAATRTPGPDLAHVTDVRLGGRPARVYRPDDDPATPLLLWLHGGGWTIGGLDSFDRMARRLAAASGLAVALLDYRLAPEHPWPAAVDDSVAALVSLVAQRDRGAGSAPARIGVGGDSAGGLLAALACLRLARELPAAGRPVPDALVMAYANTDLGGDHPSRREKARGFGLDAELTRFFNRQWVPDESRWSAPGVSPLRAASLRGLPPARVVTCEHDILRDEGAAFADRLRAEGVPVGYRCEPGMIHNFLLYDELSPAAAAAGDRLAADAAEVLRG